MWVRKCSRGQCLWMRRAAGHQRTAPSSWISCLRWVGFIAALPKDNLQRCLGANKKGLSWREELLLVLEIQKKSLP